MSQFYNNNLVLTVDIEDWFHSLDYHPNNWIKYERRVGYGTNKILELLKQNNSSATFFILGDVARNHPQLVRQIYNEGHEIGSHGFDHKFIYKQTPEEFRNDLRRSINILSDLTGEKIISYRAPYFSITKKSLWALNILKEEGIENDSSIFPVINHRYGIPKSNRLPYKMENGLWEWPITTFRTLLGNIPFAGGVYFRFYPGFVTQLFISKLIRHEPVLLYFHPWEIDLLQPRMKNISPFLRIRHYYGLKNNIKKISALLNRFTTISLNSAIKLLKKNKDE